MATIGVEIEQDELILTKGRDFSWAVKLVDPEGEPLDFPAGQMFFELETGGEHNAIQEVSVTAANGGVYKLGLGGFMTDPIDYYDATVNPEGMSGDITDAIEALSTIGAGNVLVHPATLTPVWQINISLNAGHNEIQEILIDSDQINGANGGSFKVGLGTSVSGLITFGSDADAVKTKIEALPGVGTGNVSVTKISNWHYRVEFIGALAATDVGQLFSLARGIGWGLTGGILPQVRTRTVIDGLAKLTEPLVNVLNNAVNDLFDSFEDLAGVDIDFVVNDEINASITVTSKRSYSESELLTFAISVTSNMVKGAVNGLSDFVGMLDTVSVDFYWNHVYQVEFIEELSNLPIPLMTTDISDLEGTNGDQNVSVKVIEPGKHPLTLWHLAIAEDIASIKVDSELTALVPNRCKWQLVFLPDGEAAGGDPITAGKVRWQGR
ncbi:hypothetical protein MycrhDRAFT_6888 [Mycolicibacterium rhodesiae JS60]|nr:hypothetical protein MycrhDRAFT_6888 [Mycolicibacterium rhodesiae JS60]